MSKLFLSFKVFNLVVTNDYYWLVLGAFNMSCQVVAMYLVGEQENQMWRQRVLEIMYHMVGNFHGAQIFMDFMHSAYPQKIADFQLYNTK